MELTRDEKMMLVDVLTQEIARTDKIAEDTRLPMVKGIHLAYSRKCFYLKAKIKENINE